MSAVISRYGIGRDQFFESLDDDFKFILGKYHGSFLSEIDDIKYLRGLKYKDTVKPTPEFLLALNDRIEFLVRNTKMHGLYFFYDEHKTLIYVGKGNVDFCKRLFNSLDIRQTQTGREIHYVKIMLPETVSDNNLLEQYFILTHKPRLNIEFMETDSLTIHINNLDLICQSELIKITPNSYDNLSENNHLFLTYNSLRNKPLILSGERS